MKMITAIIRPHALELVRAGIQDIGISGLTVTEVKGYGRQKGHNEMYRGAEYTINFQPKIKLELVVGDDDVQKPLKPFLPVPNPEKSVMAKFSFQHWSRLFVSERVKPVKQLFRRVKWIRL